MIEYPLKICNLNISVLRDKIINDKIIDHFTCIDKFKKIYLQKIIFYGHNRYYA